MRSCRVNIACRLTIASYLLCLSWCALPALGQGEIYAAYYVPDAIDHAGSIFVYLHNPTSDPLTVEHVSLDGQSIGKIWLTDESFLEPDVREQYIQVENPELDWYRVYPNPIPPDQIAEVILRLSPSAAQVPQRQIAVTIAGQEPLINDIPLSESDFTLEYIGIGPELDELHIYAQSGLGASVHMSRVEVDGVAIGAAIKPEYRGFTYARVRLETPWQYGSFHAVAIGTDTDLKACLIRALPTPPPLGIMGNNSEREIELYRNNLFETNIAFTAVPAERYEPLARYGLGGSYIYSTRLKPGEDKSEPVFYNDVGQLAPIRGLSALWAYFLEDEPDGRYHLTDLPHGSIVRDVERANQFCRIFDPATPTYLQMDHGSYPRNLYTWGQMPDYICAHAYGIGRGNLIGSTQEHVSHTQAACRPRPFLYLNEGYCRNEQRHFEPDEMRMEVYTALATGAKSLQWYPAHGERGLLNHPAMWNAVGEVNGILHQVLPLLAIGIPVGSPEIEGGNYLSSLILCGDKALVLILVNRDFQSNPEQFLRTDAPTARVRVILPEFMRTAGAGLVARVRFPGGQPDIPFEFRNSTLSFGASANPVEMLVIYSDESVFEGLRHRHAEALAAYVPMPEE
jgi:hypothetical protein